MVESMLYVRALQAARECYDEEFGARPRRQSPPAPPEEPPRGGPWVASILRRLADRLDPVVTSAT